MSSTKARLPLIDLLRGLALWAMFAFHLVWDLAQFGWIDRDTPYTPLVHWFGHAIAVSFLLLVGVSLVLAETAKGPLWRSASYWRRWGQVALAAAAISAMSFWLFPATPIFFGILHCIALASLIALPFVAAPPVWALSLGVAALLAPHFFAAPVFDAKVFWWTGLGTFQPASNDFRPLLPWTAYVLFGVALARWTNAGRLSPRHREPQGVEKRPSSTGDGEAIQDSVWPQSAGRQTDMPGSRPVARNDGPLFRALTFCGRHSLAFYLIHQPLLFGFFTLLGLVATPSPDARDFVRQCAVQCVNEGVEAEICEKSCACVVEKAKGAGLWNKLAQDKLTPPQKSVVHDAAMACYAEAMGK